MNGIQSFQSDVMVEGDIWKLLAFEQPALCQRGWWVSVDMNWKGWALWNDGSCAADVGLGFGCREYMLQFTYANSVATKPRRLMEWSVY
jgi:hypothetical protein